jgi:GNAT superfamily N-acetyltransferase
MSRRQTDPAPPAMALRVEPLTAARWETLARLFGPKGALSGCWCMWWRLSRADFQRGRGEGNRGALRALAAGGEPPGVLAYVGDEPVGWCAIAPRERTPTLERSPTLKAVDDAPVWSVTCFFLARPWRRRGLALPLLEAAVAYAAARGARIVEGYPVEAGEKESPPYVNFMGLASTFRAAGFREVLRRSPRRPILRRVLMPGTPRSVSGKAAPRG